MLRIGPNKVKMSTNRSAYLCNPVCNALPPFMSLTHVIIRATVYVVSLRVWTRGARVHIIYSVSTHMHI